MQVLAAKAYFQPSERRTIGAPGRSGSGRRGGSRWSWPRQVKKDRVGQIAAARRHLLGHGRHQSGPARRLGLRQGLGGAQHQGIGPVGQGEHHDDLTRHGPLEHVGQGEPGLRRTEIADRPREVGCQDPGGETEAGGDRPDRPGVEARDDGVVDVVLGHPGRLEGVGEGLTGQGDVHLLAETFLPDVRVHLAGDPPAVEELVAGRAPSDELGHRALRTAEEGHPTVAGVTLL